MKTAIIAFFTALFTFEGSKPKRKHYVYRKPKVDQEIQAEINQYMYDYRPEMLENLELMGGLRPEGRRELAEIRRCLALGIPYPNPDRPQQKPLSVLDGLQIRYSCPHCGGAFTTGFPNTHH